MQHPAGVLQMEDISPVLAVALMHACRTSLEELTITPSEGFHAFMNTQREHWGGMDHAPMHLQNLQTLTLHIQKLYHPDSSTWSDLDDAMEILHIASTSNLASLELKFNPHALFKLSDDLGNPSLEQFEQ